LRSGVRSIEHGYILDVETARLMKEHDCYFDPTLSVTRSPNWMKEHGFEDWTIKKAVEAGNTHKESVKLAIKEGVKIVTGTDLPPGDLNEGVVTTVREMEFIGDAGLSIVDVLKSATITAARLCQIQDRVGAIKPDYCADLIAVEENPLRNLKALERIKFVMKDGDVMRNDFVMAA
jgi:imidazolonepropionase-like amidohydrolase